jgi:hypothetical protein
MQERKAASDTGFYVIYGSSSEIYDDFQPYKQMKFCNNVLHIEQGTTAQITSLFIHLIQ